jgi:adenosylcobinamide-phosphate synthase
LKRSSLLIAAFLLDQVAGDPEWFPHPVRLMGRAIEHGETALRLPNQSSAVELASGAVLSIAVVAASYSIATTAIRQAYCHSETLGRSVEILLGWTCLASRSLQREAEAVMNALASGNIRLARQRLARIVGRDTQLLDASEVRRAVIETVAESASDGIIAPLFYWRWAASHLPWPIRQSIRSIP